MVLKRISRSLFGASDPTTSSIPDGERVYAVGDVHGRLDLLEDLLDQIVRDNADRPASRTTIVFLGDLIDRGPDSCGVVERLRLFTHDSISTCFLLGNHDEIFLKAAEGDLRALKLLCRIGGRETILSYGISASDYDASDYEELGGLLRAHVPTSHVAFLSSFHDFKEIGDYIFVHAGIRPGCPITEQRPADMRWIRDEFLRSRARHPKMVVHGHSISEAPEFRSNRIGIDTGAFATGTLTALGLEGSSTWLLSTEGQPDDRWGRLTD